MKQGCKSGDPQVVQIARSFLSGERKSSKFQEVRVVIILLVLTAIKHHAFTPHIISLLYLRRRSYLPPHQPIELSTHIHTYIHTYGYTALVDIDRFFSFLIYIQSVGLIGRGISPPQGRYLHTE
jgi:hypothetical protein